MIHDLGIIMITAGIISLLFKWLKQPVVLGYIVAGMVSGPYLCGESWIADIHSVDMWGQVGVIFLLFALGLEFSFKKLIQVGATAFVGTITIVVGMMTTGFLVGRLMGWSEMNSLFLGGMLCMSSTTIVFKTLEDLGMSNQQFSKVCLGILIVEDLFAVLLMVLLSSIAVKNSFEGDVMIEQVAKLGAYLLAWFVLGITIIPTFLSKCKKHLNDETLTILSLGLCLGMVLLAIGAGFSAALGAFVMGSILAETIEAEHIEKLVKPIKDVFGAIFFVSVGMMIDPKLLSEYCWPIVIIALVVIVGQIFFVSLGVLLSGQPLKVSLQSGFALAQIGEFAFIIASLGESLHVTEKYLYPIVVAVSVLTTFLTPYIIRLSDPAFTWLNSHLSPSVRLWLQRYAQGRNTITMQSTWQKLLHKVLLSLIIYVVITIFIMVFYFQYVSGYVVDFIALMLPMWMGKLVSLLLLLAIITPLIYKIATKHARCEEANELWSSGSYRKGALVGLSILRILLCLGIIIFAIADLFALTYGVLVAISVVVVLGILYSSRVHRSSAKLEEGFMRNLSAREVAQAEAIEKSRPIKREFEQRLLSYDLHLADFVLSASSSYSGRILKELDLRRKSGVTVVRIVRGGMNVNMPGGNERLFPGDHIVVAGSDAQISKFQHMLLAAEMTLMEEQSHSAKVPITLEQFIVTESLQICGKSVAESHIREMASCAVIGIERNGKSFMNPDSSMTFEAGDMVILAGEAPKIKEFLMKIEMQAD